MPFGIIFDGSAPKQPASFYIPTALYIDTPALHVYLGHAARSDISEAARNTEKTVIVEMQYPSDEFLAFLGLLPCSRSRFAVVAPISGDSDVYVQLKNLHMPLILRYALPVSDTLVDQYKCLRYGALLVDMALPVDTRQISLLLAKSSKPHLLTFSAFAADTPKWQALANTPVPPYSDVLVTPLQPLVQDLLMEVYEEFEKDAVKYMQYERAIAMAIGDLRREEPRVLIVGPGRGPLVDMVGACVQNRPHWQVDVVEKNPKCGALLEAKCRHLGFSFREGDCRDMPGLDKYDLVVSELLGSFGCNEACPEILSFSSHAVFIPESFSAYLHPVYSDVLANQSVPQETELFLAKLNSVYSPCAPAEVFEFRFPGESALSQKSAVTFDGRPGHFANALCGYFLATLYGPYRISILPGLHPDEYCLSWFPIFFPMREETYPLEVEMRRCSAEALVYRYTVNGTEYQSTRVELSHTGGSVLMGQSL